LVPRDIVAVLLDIENISAKPVTNLSLDFSSWSPDKNERWHLRSLDHMDDLLGSAEKKHWSFPPEVLLPREHFIVPLYLCLGEYEDYYGELPKKYALWQFGPTTSVSTIRFTDALREPVVSSVRKLDTGKLHYLNEFEIAGGSCPFIYCWNNTEQKWVDRQRLITGAIGKHKEMWSIVPLSQFEGRLQIREEEDEITFIDYVELRLHDDLGHPHSKCISDDRLLSKPDGLYRRLMKGEHMNMSTVQWKPGMKAELVIKGYYTPKVKASVQKN